MWVPTTVIPDSVTVKPRSSTSQIGSRELAPTATFTIEPVDEKKLISDAIAGMEGNKLEIDFEQAGTKKVLDSFVVPAEKAG